MIIFLCLALAGGRVVTAGNKVDAAAEDAAREASISRTVGAARSNALSAARETLADQGLKCSGTRVSVDASGLNAPWAPSERSGSRWPAPFRCPT